MENLIQYDQLVITNVKGKKFIYDVSLYSSHKTERDAFFNGLTDYMNQTFGQEFTVDQVKLRWKRIRDDYTKGIKILKEGKTLTSRLSYIRDACYEFLEEYLNVKSVPKPVVKNNCQLSSTVNANDQPGCSYPNAAHGSQQLEFNHSGLSADGEKLNKSGQTEETPEDEAQSASGAENTNSIVPLSKTIPGNDNSGEQRHNFETQSQQHEQQQTLQATSTAAPSSLFSGIGIGVPAAPKFVFRRPILKQKPQQSRSFADQNFEESLSEPSDCDSSSDDSDLFEDCTQRRQKNKYPKKPPKTKHDERATDVSDIDNVLALLIECIEKNKSYDRVRARASVLCKFLDRLDSVKQIKAIRVLMDIFKKYETKKKNKQA